MAGFEPKTMIAACKDWSIVEYVEQDLYQDLGGIFVPSEELKRDLVRHQDKKLFVSGEYLPDIVRLGIYRSGDAGVPEGVSVLFNKHDGTEFWHGEKHYYTIPSRMIIATIE